MKLTTLIKSTILLMFVASYMQAQEHDSYITTKKSKLKFIHNSSLNSKKDCNNFSITTKPKYFGKTFKKTKKTKRFELNNQTYNDVEIYTATIKVNFDNNGTPILYNDNTIDIKKVDKSNFPEIELIENYSNIKLSDTLETKKVYFPISESEIIPALKVVYQKDNKSYLSIFNSNYDIIYNQSLSFDKNIETFPANASVFNPDPITSAKTVYDKDTDFSHNNGASNPSLERQQKDVEIECRKIGDTYYLENNYCVIRDWDSPRWDVVTSTTGNFNFNRSQVGFQQVNAFYHISEMKKYLNYLGFEDAVDYQINIDADGENGQDNSHFSPSGRQGKITYGAFVKKTDSEGNDNSIQHIPDAEDAEVVIHEYTHAISNSYNEYPKSPERFSLEEAMADYIAVSYSRAIDDYEWEKIFKWDAHNEFWNGRMATSNLCYDNIYSFPSNDYYRYSGVWTAPLMEMYSELGKETTDKLVLHTISALDRNTTMEQAALIMMSMDTVYNNHQNAFKIFKTFKRYCILDESHLALDDFELSQIKIINSQAFAHGGEMRIDFNGLFNGEIDVYNISGIKIYSEVLNNEIEFRMSSENLNSGIYLINIKSNNSTKTIKVVKY